MSALGATEIVRVFEFAKRNEFGCTLGNASSPEHAATKYLPNRSKQRLLSDLCRFANENPQFQHLPNQLKQWAAELNSIDISAPEHRASVQQVMFFINDMDASRGLSFREIQPQLYEEYVAECGAWAKGLRFALRTHEV